MTSKEKEIRQPQQQQQQLPQLLTDPSDNAPSKDSTGAFSGQRCTSKRTAGMLAAASVALERARSRCSESVEDHEVPGSAEDAQDWRLGIVTRLCDCAPSRTDRPHRVLTVLSSCFFKLKYITILPYVRKTNTDVQ
jgi:hypothetical protein